MRNFYFILHYFCLIFVCRAFLLMYCSIGFVQVSELRKFWARAQKKSPKLTFSIAHILLNIQLSTSLNIAMYVEIWRCRIISMQKISLLSSLDQILMTKSELRTDSVAILTGTYLQCLCPYKPPQKYYVFFLWFPLRHACSFLR